MSKAQGKLDFSVHHPFNLQKQFNTCVEFFCLLELVFTYLRLVGFCWTFSLFVSY